MLGISKTYLSSTKDTNANNATKKPNQQLPQNSSTKKKIPLTIYCKYNPLPDKNNNNVLYLLTILKQQKNLHPSENYQFKLTGLPM